MSELAICSNSADLATRQSPAPYLQPVAAPINGAPAFYTLQCSSATTSVVAAIDGVAREFACGVDGFTAAFFASSVETPGGQPVVSPYSFLRFLF